MRIRTLWKVFPALALAASSCVALAGCAASSAEHPESGAFLTTSVEVAARSDSYSGRDSAAQGGRAAGAAQPLGYTSFGLSKFADTDGNGLPSTKLPEQPPERLLIQRAELRVAVGSTDETGKAATRIAKELGGYAQSTSNESVVLRIPAARFDEALDRVTKLGRVLSRGVYAQDVTEEVVDLRLRLKNALALRDRLAQLVEKADKIEDILKIEAELTRLRTEVEKLEGRLKLLETDVAFSLITMTLVELREAPRAIGLPFSWLHELGLERLLGGR